MYPFYFYPIEQSHLMTEIKHNHAERKAI